jgi:hypothetical protein
VVAQAVAAAVGVTKVLVLMVIGNSSSGSINSNYSGSRVVLLVTDFQLCLRICH